MLAVACLALAPPAFPGKGGQGIGVRAAESSSPAGAARPKLGCWRTSCRQSKPPRESSGLELPGTALCGQF